MKKTLEKDISSFKVELDRIEDTKAVLFTEDGTEILIPTKMMPKVIEDGDSFILTISTDEAESKRKAQTAKELLNEILKN